MLYADVDIFQQIYDQLVARKLDKAINIQGQVTENPYLSKLLRALRMPTCSFNNFETRDDENEASGRGY